MRTWIVIAALSVAACSDDGDADLEAARTRWETAASASYHFTWRESCFAGCLTRGAEVTVTNGAISQALYADTGYQLLPDDRARLKTIDELFGWLADRRGEVDELRVDYDAELGYPRSVAEDPRRGRTDDELGILISDLVLTAR